MTLVNVWPHQQFYADDALARISRYGGFGLWHGMRVGKTVTALAIADGLSARRVLVVAPRAVVEDERTWIVAAQRHGVAGDTLELRGTSVQKAAQVARFGDGMITVTWDAMWRDPLASALRDWGADLLVTDEAHMGASPSSRRAKYLLPLAKTVQARLGLSGTPMGQTPMGVWSPYQVLAPGDALFPPTFSQFRMRYTRAAEYGERWVDGRIARDVIITAGRGGDLTYWKLRDLEDMSERMYRCASRVLTDDVVQQTPMTTETLHVTFEPAAARIYRELDKEFIADLGGGSQATVANAMVKRLRLQQATGGALEDEDGAKVVVSQAKMRRLAEWLEGVGDTPVVVVARFHHDLDAIHEACALAGMTSGELSGRRRELAEWKAGETQVLAMQERVGGAGIDLTRASLMVFYSLSDSLLDFDQTMARPRGPMQKRNVAVYFMVVGGTVDVDILDGLEARAEISDFVTERGMRRRAALTR